MEAHHRVRTQGASAVTIEIQLLGGFRVSVDGTALPDGAWRRRHAAGLVKLLALAPNRTLHREQVIDALWPDLTIAEAAPRLHKAAYFARRALGRNDGVVLSSDLVALFPDAEVVTDVATVESVAGSDPAKASSCTPVPSFPPIPTRSGSTATAPACTACTPTCCAAPDAGRSSSPWSRATRPRTSS